VTRRIITQSFPDPPKEWDASTQDVWRRLIQVLEASNLFDKARRNRLQFVVKGTVSSAVTLDLANPSVTANTNILGHLLVALQGAPYLDVRTTVA
jgi:hypothetical protein